MFTASIAGRGSQRRHLIVSPSLIVILIGLMIAVPARAPAATITGCDNPPTHSVVGQNVVRSTNVTFANANTWLYGDSITVQTWRGVKVRGGLAVDAMWGRYTRHGITTMKRDLARWGAPENVVIALGTNDRRQPDIFRAEVDRALAALPRRVHVYWVNLYTEVGVPSNPLNRIIEDSRADVIRWARAQGTRPSTLLIDGKHVNAAGCAVRAALVNAAI